MKVTKVGFIINPIAGMGGKVGLKGTDGAAIYQIALDSGALPEAPQKATLALEQLKEIKKDLIVITCPGKMGESVVESAGFNFKTVGNIPSGITSPEHTEEAAQEMCQAKVDLLIFAGGDGTAINVYNAVGNSLPVIGIPSGVKMHSAVFGSTPRNAGQLAALFLKGQSIKTHEAEVMDIDEEEFRNQRVSAKLYGYLRVPHERKFLQNVKTGRAGKEDIDLKAIAFDVINMMDEDSYYIIGPGTTTREVMRQLQLVNTLLGVDVIHNKRLLANDVNERQLLQIINDKPFRIVVTMIGGQGYIFGRGNQQISSKVIKKAGKKNIIVIATKSKVFSLRGGPLLVDTGDERLDKQLSGYFHVITGLKERLVCRVK